MIALVCLPPYLLWRGVPSVEEYIAVLCLMAPLLAAILLSRTGRLWVADAVSTAALAGLLLCVAAMAAGDASSAIIFLVGPAIAGHAGALALVQTRRDGARQAADRSRAARDRSFLTVIDDLVTWHDRDGHVVEASGGATKLFGVPAGALRGRGLFSRVHVSDRPAFLKAISDAATSEDPIVVQFRIHVARQSATSGGPAAGGDNRVIWAEMRVGRVEGGGEGEPCAVAVMRDISARTLHAEELETARAETERAGVAKGQFLAMVSHELRTPLNAIIGFSDVLANTAGPALGAERRQEYLHIIRDSGEHLLQIVNTLLDMSKIEAGRFDVAPEPFDIVSFANGCCDVMGLRAERAGVLLTRDIAAGLPELVADRRACKQMMLNLLANAIKFTPPGGRVTLSARRERDRIVFAVADTGIGISEEDLPKVGDPFFQAGSAYDRRHEGTGLGLSVVRGLVGLHRGSLTIESAPDEGTSVTVSLPIDCRTGPSRKAAPVRIHALPRPQAQALVRKVG